jgi:uncharacterized sulfatase
MTWKSWIRAARTDAALRARMQKLMQRPPEELYDLDADPWEQRDLADQPEHAETLARLRGELDRWMRESGDPLSAG